MCIVAIAHLASSRFPLIVAANRDELYARPSAAADWWDDSEAILGGRDLQAGGTWLGIGRSGRFAAVTNIHEPAAAASGQNASRGRLTTEFLRGQAHPAKYVSALEARAAHYGPYRLIVRDGASMSFASNRMPSASLDPGCHVFTSSPPGASSARADRMAGVIQAALERRNIEEFLLDALTGPDARGAAEREMDAVFVVGQTFGTRCATVLTIDSKGRASFLEQRFTAGGVPAGQSRFAFEIDA